MTVVPSARRTCSLARRSARKPWTACLVTGRSELLMHAPRGGSRARRRYAEPVRIDIVTIFPEFFSVLDVSLLGRARQTGVLDIRVHDLRDFTHDRHRTVDDTPAGGGAGMVMKPEPWGEALDAVLDRAETPRGRLPDAGRVAVHAGARTRPQHARAPRVLLRPLRGHRPARDRAHRRPARRRGARAQPRRLRAQRRRGRGDGDDRGGRDGSSRASSATPRASSRRVTRTACSSTRATRSPRSGAASRRRPCCSAATTPRSPPGVASSSSSAPAGCAPTCSTGRRLTEGDTG